MKKNPIRKMHVGWSVPLASSGEKPESVKRWVAICPKCNLKLVPPRDYYYGYPLQNTRKAAKDGLYRHMLVFH